MPEIGLIDEPSPLERAAANVEVERFLHLVACADEIATLVVSGALDAGPDAVTVKSLEAPSLRSYLALEMELQGLSSPQSPVRVNRLRLRT